MHPFVMVNHSIFSKITKPSRFGRVRYLSYREENTRNQKIVHALTLGHITKQLCHKLWHISPKLWMHIGATKIYN